MIALQAAWQLKIFRYVLYCFSQFKALIDSGLKRLGLAIWEHLSRVTADRSTDQKLPLH